MNTRQALQLSVATEPNVLAQTIETQRQQLKDKLHAADIARAQEDWEAWAVAARAVADLTKALEENLEQNMRLADLAAFTPGALITAALKDPSWKDDPAAIKKMTDALAKLAKKPGGARARV